MWERHHFADFKRLMLVNKNSQTILPSWQLKERQGRNETRNEFFFRCKMVSKGDNVRALFLLLLGPSPSGQSGILPLSAQILHGTPKCHITRLCMDMDNSCHHVYDSRSHWWIPYSCVSFILDLWFLNIPSCAVFWSSMDIKLWYWKSFARAWTKKTLSVNILP